MGFQYSLTSLQDPLALSVGCNCLILADSQTMFLEVAHLMGGLGTTLAGLEVPHAFRRPDLVAGHCWSRPGLNLAAWEQQIRLCPLV